MNSAIDKDGKLYMFGIVLGRMASATSSLLKTYYNVLGRKTFCQIMSPWLIWGLKKCINSQSLGS